MIVLQLISKHVILPFVVERTATLFRKKGADSYD